MNKGRDLRLKNMGTTPIFIRRSRMLPTDAITNPSLQADHALARQLSDRLVVFLAPLLLPCDQHLGATRRHRSDDDWYLLSADRIETAEAAWCNVFAYAWRYGKSELAMERSRGLDLGTTATDIGDGHADRCVSAQSTGPGTARATGAPAASLVSPDRHPLSSDNQPRSSACARSSAASGWHT